MEKKKVQRLHVKACFLLLVLLTVCSLSLKLSLSKHLFVPPTDQGSSAPVSAGQLLSRLLRVCYWNQTISHAGAAAGQRGTGLLYVHGTLKPWRLCAFHATRARGRESECI